MNKAIFLDRDGTINVDFGYVSDTKKLQFIEGVTDALLKFQDAGYLLIIITNQSGIGRGFFSQKQSDNFNNYMKNKLKESFGINIAEIFTCPHIPEDNCSCRKPSPNMIIEAVKKNNIDIGLSYMIGDKESDIIAGELAGLTSFLVKDDKNLKYWADIIVND